MARRGGFGEGWITRVDLLSGSRYIWWGREVSGDEEFVGTSSGRVASASTVDALVDFVRAQGWDGIAHTDDDARIDLRPAQHWLRSGGSLDAASAVDLWNLAEDVLRSTSGHSLTTGAATDGLHARLTEIVVPYLAAGGVPAAWTAHELRRLHPVLDRAEHVVRNALDGRSRPHR